MNWLNAGYFRNSGSERRSLILSEIVFALGDILSFINNRAFEQVGEFVGKDQVENDSSQIFNPNKALSGLESIELLIESIAELHSLRHGSDTLKWAAVSAIQFLK